MPQPWRRSRRRLTVSAAALLCLLGRGAAGNECGFVDEEQAKKDRKIGGENIYSHDLCCKQWYGGVRIGPTGNFRCWGDGYTYERCCALRRGDGNDLHLPDMDSESLLIAPARPADFGGSPVLRLRQNITEAPWDDLIPGVLWRQGYAMLRWLEDLPDELFAGRTVLELGSGVGLLCLHALARGSFVTCTDGHSKALEMARVNAQANLPQSTFWNRLSLRLLPWADAQTPEDIRLHGLLPPFDVVICSALIYQVDPEHAKMLLHLMWLCTDASSLVLWGSGVLVREKQERWAMVLRCFELLEESDAVAAGYTAIQGTTVEKLRRRAAPADGVGSC